MQSFIDQKKKKNSRNHQIFKNIFKSSNQISYITNITYLSPNNKIYNLFQEKKYLIKVLGLSFLTTVLPIGPLKTKSIIIETFLALSRTLPQNSM